MAEFCNKCNERWKLGVDINVYKIHRNLKEGETQYVLCEGCEMVAIQKGANGELLVGYQERGKQELIWKPY